MLQIVSGGDKDREEKDRGSGRLKDYVALREAAISRRSMSALRSKAHQSGLVQEVHSYEATHALLLLCGRGSVVITLSAVELSWRNYQH